MADAGLFSMLNHYCVFEVFKHLSVFHLANVKQAYGSLAALVDTEFERQTRRCLRLLLDDKIDAHLQIIKRFGSSIEELTINYDNLHQKKWSDIFAVVNEHCKENLKTFALTGSAIGWITKADIRLLADILKTVEAVQLGPFFGDDDSQKKFIKILYRCTNVKSITMLPISGDITPTKIFRKNKKLLKLVWHGRLEDNYYKMVIDNLMQTRLEELAVMTTKKNFNENLCRLLRLKYLKRLTIDCWHEDISPFLQKVNAFQSLNVLCLSFARFYETDIARMGQMKNVKVLKLDGVLSTSNQFASVLVLCGNENFEHILLFCSIEGFDNMDEEHFRKLIDKRKASTPAKCLHLTLRRDIYAAILRAVPFELIEANSKTIKLIDQDDLKYEYHNLK